jgi:large subunit ribosomal protein L13
MNHQITASTKQDEVVRAWHIIDLDSKILGRSATQIAGLLMGKAKPKFVRNLDCGDYVVVVNAEKVRVTGKKEEQKSYYRYSGYPGGLTIEQLRDLRERRPEEIIMRAVKGMLPQNKLRDRMLRRLKVFVGPTHTYEEKLKGKN